MIEGRVARRRLELIATVIMLMLAVASYGLALWSPVYSDEIDWKLMQGHYIDDGYVSRSATMAPSCGADTFSTPALLIPIRYVDSLTTSLLSQPRDVRLYGLLMFMLWAGVTWWLLRRLLAPDTGSSEIVVGLVATVTLGVMPLLMVVSRPEQVMLIGMSVFLILAVRDAPVRQRPVVGDLALALAVVAGSALVLGSHPRALLILPVIVLACLRVIRRRAISFAAAAIGTVFAIVAFRDFSTRLICPGDPTIRHRFGFDSIAVATSDHMLGAYLHQLAGILREKPGEFFFLTQFGFNDSYVAQMIPPYPYAEVGVVVTWLVGAFISALAFIAVAALALTAVARIRKRQGLIALMALVSAWALLAVSMVARATRNTYEAEFLEPLIVLVSVLSLWFAREELQRQLGHRALRRFSRLGFACLVTLSISSQILLLAGYVPIAERSWSRPGYIPAQRLSVSSAGYSSIREESLAAAARCNINPSNVTENLVVDELTFFAFRHTRTPYLMTYLYPDIWTRPDVDLPGLLRRKHSAGVIVGCQWMVPAFTRVIQTNGLCCIPKF